MILKLLGWRGIAGIGVALMLGILLLVQKGETRHWKKQSGQFEQLYHEDQAAFAKTVADYRAAADQARAADQANAARVAAEQSEINERNVDEYQVRLADADARYRRLLAATAAADSGAGGNASVPGAGTDRPQAPGSAGQDGLSLADRYTATRQAIQLDQLIKAIKGLQAINPNQPAPKP